tara:strand:+ start:447 stop:1595 length:1149 start_codon:yes stop_codon:yes gene_type:complete
MTISTTNSRNDYTASSSQTTFAYTFPVTTETDILVYQDGTLKSLTTHYTVSATPTGNVVFGSGLDSGTKVALVRSVPLTQSSDYVENDPFSAETHEDALDRLTIIAQQIDEEVGRSLKLAPSSTTSNLTIPEPSADKYLAWNSAADALENKDIASVSAIALPVPVSSGGIGVATLTDGGVLLGNGTSAVQAMAVLADGEMIVGDGTTDPVAESGATLRTSIGVGTGDSPQFTAINVGHASDTTLAKEASGVLAVEGNTIASLDLKQVWTKAQAPATFSATLASVSGVLDYDAFQNFIITLASGSNTLAAPTTEADCIGQTGVMIFIQPSSSSAGTLSLHADYETAASAGITLSTANNDYDIVPYVVKADNSILLGAPQLNFG